MLIILFKIFVASWSFECDIYLHIRALLWECCCFDYYNHISNFDICVCWQPEYNLFCFVNCLSAWNGATRLFSFGWFTISIHQRSFICWKVSNKIISYISNQIWHNDSSFKKLKFMMLSFTWNEWIIGLLECRFLLIYSLNIRLPQSW